MNATVLTPQRPEGEAVRYEVIEAADLIPSHNPDGFGPHPDYPVGVQERDYLAQPEEQLKVATGAAKLNPAILLSDTPSPLDGPPIVTAGVKRLVLGGNGRSMMILRAFRDPRQRNTYRRALEARAEYLGIERDDIDSLNAPVLVRTVECLTSASGLPELTAAVRRFNEGMTQQLSPMVLAVAESRALSLGTIEAISDLLVGAINTPHPSGGEWSLRHIMADKVLGARAATLIEILRRDDVINQQNQALWLRGGELTPEAKERIEAMFMGRILGTAARFNSTAASIIAKLERIVPYVLRVAGINPALDVTDTLREAVDLLNDAGARMTSIESLLAQPAMFGPGPSKAAETVALLLANEPVKSIAARFKAWSGHSAHDPRQLGMFTVAPTLESSRAVLFRDDEAKAA